jgi:RND family efflux transporter MFP subunit
MPGKRNILLSVITQVTVSVVLLAMAGGVAAMLWHTRPEPAKIDEPPRLRRVEVMRALAVPVRRQWQGFGTARARDEADIPAEVTAVVIDIPPQIVEGAQIARGDAVALLDDTDFVIQQQISAQRIEELAAQLGQLDLEEASWKRRVELSAEEVRLAEADYERVTLALKRQAARDREVDQSREKLLAAIRVEVMAREQFDRIGPRRAQLSAMKSLQASSLRLAEKNVQRCTIRSPLDGFVATVDIEIGESVAPGQRVCRVVNLDRMEVPLRLPSSSRLGVTVGDEVVLNAQDNATPPWQGEIRRISPLDDQNTRTMTVYVEIEQDPFNPGWLAPGRFVDGRVISRRTELRYVVPRRSLLGERLLVIEDGTVHSRPVNVDFHVQGEFEQLGVSAEQWAVLVDSLDDGLQVVINAARSLPDGLRVEPVSMRSDHRDQRASRHAELSE